MKKVITMIIVFLIFLILYFLQSNFFSWFNIAGIKPNLFIILALFLGLILGQTCGGIFGIVEGLILDLFIGKRIGINAISLGIVGLFAGMFKKNIANSNRMTIALIVSASTLIGEAINYIYQMILFSGNFEIIAFFKIVLIEIVFNLLITIIINNWIRRGLEKTKEVFTSNKILTRTF